MACGWLGYPKKKGSSSFTGAVATSDATRTVHSKRHAVHASHHPGSGSHFQYAGHQRRRGQCSLL